MQKSTYNITENQKNVVCTSDNLVYRMLSCVKDDVDRSAILDPIEHPLPFTLFKDFTGKTQNEINLYSSEMATALASIDRVSASSNMSNRLSEAMLNSL